MGKMLLAMLSMLGMTLLLGSVVIGVAYGEVPSLMNRRRKSSTRAG